MKISVVIPARNEAECVVSTVSSIAAVLTREGIPHELIVVDDGSKDETAAVVREIVSLNANVRLLCNPGPHGFGYAIRAGLQVFTGDAVAIMMADNSDSPEDLVKYYRKLQAGAECVFGSRFIKGGLTVEYPVHKLVVNRMANWFIAALFGIGFNDTTNAFKCYRRHVIEGLRPLISPHFNLTVEMPLKAIVRGYSYSVVPICWQNRATGTSKLKLREMGSRYLFIVLYLWLEKHLSRGDYRRLAPAAQPEAPQLGKALPHA
ncbi:MAG TPA: glycosyltransferase family 2 protein [Bryobacteraceae bacterium]|nr:glycosyltransferase family 2 protein [Bryobacteraceae bacterium]